MSDGTNPSEAVTPAADVTAGEGAENGLSSVSLDELNQELGRTFKTKEAALSALKETYKYVGKAGQYEKAIKSIAAARQTDEAGVLRFMEELQKPAEAQPPRPAVEDKVKELESRLDESTFFGEKPELKSYAPLLKELRGATGKSLKDVSESEAFKSVYEKAKAHDENESKRSVLTSNPRLGQATDKLGQAREALKSGNAEAARSSAVSAVLDTFS